MKLTQQIAKELRAQGVKVNMRQVVRDSRPEPPESLPVKASEKPAFPPAPDVTPVLIEGLIQMANASEANTKNITEILREIAKPKPKRNWRCTIGRNSRGEMATVDINEA